MSVHLFFFFYDFITSPGWSFTAHVRSLSCFAGRSRLTARLVPLANLNVLPRGRCFYLALCLGQRAININLPRVGQFNACYYFGPAHYSPSVSLSLDKHTRGVLMFYTDALL